MELSKKTTILLSPELHERLTRLAKTKQTSLGQLVREACEARYGAATRQEKLEAVKQLSEMNLPVDTVEVMKEQSNRFKNDIIP